MQNQILLTLVLDGMVWDGLEEGILEIHRDQLADLIALSNDGCLYPFSVFVEAKELRRCGIVPFNLKKFKAKKNEAVMVWIVPSAGLLPI